MLDQIKYSARQDLGQRVFALAAVIVMNAVFGILGAANIYGGGGKITAVTLCSLALCGLFVVAVIADVQSLRGLFSAPAGYAVMLAPVPGRKILLGKIIPIVVMDLVSFAVGIAGVVMQAMILANAGYDSSRSDLSIWMVLVICVGYLMLITAIFFGCALAKSVFFRSRLSGLLGFAGFAAALYVLSWLDISMAAFAPLTRFGPFFNITIYAGLNAATIAYIILGLAKSAVLFVSAAYLIDRRINL